MKTYTKEELKIVLELHVKWLNDEEGGERANLESANLESANLKSAYWDYSSGFTLSCRGSRFTASVKLVYQYLAHLCTIKPAEGEEAELKEIQDAIRKYAVRSHRAKDLEILDGQTENGKDEQQ